MKLRNLVASATLLAAGPAFGAAGMFDQFIFTTTNTTAPQTYYDIGATTANADFQGNDLGIFNVGDTFYIGGQQKSYKNNGTDVTSHGIAWRVYTVTPSGSFTNVAMPFQSNLATPGDQQWGGNTSGANANPIEISTNVLAGLSNGNYHLQVYTFITTNGVNENSTVNNNAGGNFYTAAFTVVPEPSSALIGLLGGAVLLLRRRR